MCYAWFPFLFSGSNSNFIANVLIPQVDSLITRIYVLIIMLIRDPGYVTNVLILIRDITGCPKNVPNFGALFCNSD